MVLKIQFTYQYFWPDTPPYANMLRMIGGHLSSIGHDVFMLTAPPSYKSGASESSLPVPLTVTVDGITVRRLRNLPGTGRFPFVKVLNKVLFPLRAFLSVLWRRLTRQSLPEVIVVATIPPVLNGLFGLLAARVAGAKFVYHFQDIYPELGGYAGIWKSSGWIYQFLLRIDSYVSKSASICMVLSEDMKNTLIDRGVSEERIYINNNFMLQNFSDVQPSPTDSDASKNCSERSGPVRFIFAGNIGRFQGLEDVLSAFLELDFDTFDAELVFLGEGKALPELKSLSAGHPRVTFKGHMPFALAADEIAQADAGIVSVNEDIYRVAYPSKTLSYLGLGVPVVAIIEPESCLARSIEEAACGVVASSRSVSDIRRTFEAFFWLQSETPNLRSNAKALFEYEGAPQAAMLRWDQLISSLKASS